MSVTIGMLALVACRPADEAGAVLWVDEPIPSTARFARLTHLQWENAVGDLLHLEEAAGLSASFIGDALSEGFENDAEALQVAPELWQDYQWAAETLATSVVDAALRGEPSALDLPIAGSARPSEDWIRDLGGRAHRRPLTEEEVAAYGALFEQGADLVASGDSAADGAQVVITALLQSPFFLYRIEESTEVDASGRVPLSSYEIASKLSFGLWNTMPDDLLFEAAAADRLRSDAELREQAARMLDDPRARDTVADLHRQLLRLDNYANIVKDSALYPEFGPTTAASMAAEASAYVDDVVFSDGGVHELLTRRRSFVNEDLARIYGLEGVTGDALVPVDLDPAERAGLLTLSGFLALEADAFVHSAIRRGVLVNDEVICALLPSPPEVVPPLPPLEAGQTARERVESHTGDGTCGEGCHSTWINPIGFAFEHYDALGRYRAEEGGQPIDASGRYPFEGGARTWANAVELAAILGDAREVHTCYAGHWLAYLEGRHVVDADAATLDRIGRISRAERRSIREVVVDLLLSNGFRYRSTEVDG